MAIALVTSTAQGSTNGNSFTTSSIDTTGATLMVVAVVTYVGVSAGTLSDSKGNTWTALTTYATSGNQRVKWFYAQNPTVGTGHTFTAGPNGGLPSVGVLAFSGTATAGVFDTGQDQGYGTVGSGETSAQATASVTPSVNDCVVVSVQSHANVITDLSVNSSFTKTNEVLFDGSFNFYGIGIAYLIQTTATTVNPTWSWTGGTYPATALAVFKPATAGGSGAAPLAAYRRRQVV